MPRIGMVGRRNLGSVKVRLVSGEHTLKERRVKTCDRVKDVVSSNIHFSPASLLYTQIRRVQAGDSG